LTRILEKRAELWLTTPGGITDHITSLPEGTVS